MCVLAGLRVCGARQRGDASPQSQGISQKIPSLIHFQLLVLLLSSSMNRAEAQL
jgi:hypothetical protein